MAKKEIVVIYVNTPNPGEARLQAPQGADTYLLPDDTEINGSLTIVDGTQANGRVLLSDANGKGVWAQLLSSQVDMLSYAGPGVASVGKVSVHDMNTGTHSVGIADHGDAGLASKAGALTIDVVAGGAYIRPTDNKTDVLEYIEWAAVSGLDVTTHAGPRGDAYVYIDYTNGATIQVSSTNPDLSFERQDILHLAEIHFDAAGTAIFEVHDTRQFMGNHAQEISIFHRDVFGVLASNLEAAETGTRSLLITAGIFHRPGFNNQPVPSFDSSGLDTFSYWNEDGVGGWTEVTGATQFNNTLYDDGTGTLATMTAGYYKREWTVRSTTGPVHVLYSQGEFATQQEAEDAPLPALPQHLTIEEHSYPIASYVILKGAASGTIFDKARRFSPSVGLGAVDHGALFGLGDDDHPQYQLKAHTILHGELYYYDAAGVAYEITTGGTFQKFTDFLVGQTTGGTSIVGSAANDDLTVGADGPGKYMIETDVSLQSLSHTDVTMAVHIDGSPVTKLTDIIGFGCGAVLAPSSVVVRHGTYVSGSASDLVDRDGNYYQVAETNDPTGFAVEYYFGEGEHSSITFWGRYDGSAGHDVKVQGRNFTITPSRVANGGTAYVCYRDHTSGATTEPGVGADWASYWYADGAAAAEPAWATATAYIDGWDDLTALADDVPHTGISDIFRSWMIPNPADFTDGTNTIIRFLHVSAGVNTHDIYTDKILVTENLVPGKLTANGIVDLVNTNTIDVRLTAAHDGDGLLIRKAKLRITRIGDT